MTMMMPLGAATAASRHLSASAAAMSMPALDLPTDIGPLALNNLSDNVGARRKKRRLGRGVGSGRGRHAGRGMKGRKARSGNHGFTNFDGGQTKLQKGLPKMGAYRPRLEYTYLNLYKLQEAVERGRLVPPADRPIDVKDLFDAKLVTLRQRHAGVVLLGQGYESFKTPLRIEVQKASERAIAAVEAAGGQIEAVYYSRLTLRAKLKPHRFEADAPGRRHGDMMPRPALPPPKLMRNIYLSERQRGYLRNLQPGDVIRPHEQPGHVDLDLKHKPKYPGWDAADQQAMAAGKPFLLPDGTRASPEQIAEAQQRKPVAKTVRKENPTRPRDRSYAPPPPAGKRLVRDRLRKEELEALERSLK